MVFDKHAPECYFIGIPEINLAGDVGAFPASFHLGLYHRQLFLNP